MNRVFCSTGAFLGRPNKRDFHLIEEIAPRLSCDGFELMIYNTWYDKLTELIDYLGKISFKPKIIHFDKMIGENISHATKESTTIASCDFVLNCEIAKALHARYAVLHLWGGLDSDSNFENNIKAYEKFEKIATEYGITLLIENIVCTTKDPFSRLDELSKLFPSAHFVLDTKMAQFHSQLSKRDLNKYKHLFLENKILHMHINDYGGRHMEWERLKTLHIGRGNIDFEMLFSFLREVGYSGTFTVEGTSFDSNGIVDTVSLNSDFEYIKAHI